MKKTATYNALSDEGCITVMCGKNYVPQSMVLPVSGNCFSTKVLKKQIGVSLPVKKRIWQQILIIARVMLLGYIGNRYLVKTFAATGTAAE